MDRAHGWQLGAIVVGFVALPSSVGLAQFGLNDQPKLEKSIVYTRGEGDYAMFRVCGLVMTNRGTLLAYCEARRRETGDWGASDILVRSSSNGGATWNKPILLASSTAGFRQNPISVEHELAAPGEITIHNAIAIVDNKTKSVHFLYCVEYARCFYMRTDDEGKTFTHPVDITATFDRFHNDLSWRVLATGPGHGIQLDTGRLVVPIWLSTGTDGHTHRHSAVSVIYSDDHGRSWRPGEIAAAHPEPKNPSESTALQLADGRVLLNFRHESPSSLRGICISDDGATGWSSVRFDPQLPDPACMGSLLRISQSPEAARDRILFCNSHNPLDQRWRNLTLKLSYDEGQSWPIVKTLERGSVGYSDLALGHDGTFYCFYDRDSVGQLHRPNFLCLARFNLQWLTDGRDRFTR